MSSKARLLKMPPELQSMVANKLDAVSFCNLKLVCKGINTWIKDPPKLSALEWQQYHSAFETGNRRRRKLQTLGCSVCKKVLDRGLFSDVAVRHTLNQGRTCISCAIQSGYHDKRLFKVNGQEVFGCRGCQKAKTLSEEDRCLVDEARWFEHFPKNRDTNSFLASRGCRWCHDCWTSIINFRSLDRSPQWMQRSESSG